MFSSERVRIKTPLASDFELTEFDVLCGRGNECYNWCGNARFRKLILATLESYERAKTKVHRSLIVLNIVEKVRSESPGGGGFVRQVNGQWYEIGDEAAREKVGNTLRESLIHKDPEKLAQKRVMRAMSKANRAARSIVNDLTFILTQPDESDAEIDYFSPMPFHQEPMTTKLSAAKSAPVFFVADELLASIPPTLSHHTSREWIEDFKSDPDLTGSSFDFEGIADIFNFPTIAA